MRLQLLVERAGRILSEEAAGRLQGIEREGGLVNLKASPTVVVGDIHGDMESLRVILDGSRVESRLDEGWRLVFLGDYADRGPDSLAVYEKILRLKVEYPNAVVLMKGNHEALDLVPLHPHDLPERLREAHGKAGDAIYRSLLSLHSDLPFSAIYNGLFLLVHGGVFPGITRTSLARPSARELEMILWNDPYEEADGVSDSPRGAGVRFGPAVSAGALRALGVRQIVRSHSAVPTGYRFNHGGRVLTIFSSKEVYGLDQGAYLVLDAGKSLGECVRVF